MMDKEADEIRGIVKGRITPITSFVRTGGNRTRS
jgi:hypothetical protein